MMAFKILRIGSLNKHLQQIETVTLNTEILKYIDYVK